MRQTERLTHRMQILYYAPVFLSLPTAERDELSMRVAHAADLADLDPTDRDLIRRATVQVGDGAALDALPNSQGDHWLIDQAFDSGDEWLIERALDTVNRGDNRLSPDWAESIATEAEDYAARLRARPDDESDGAYHPGDALICTDGSLIIDDGSPDGGGAGPFTVLRVLRVNPNGSLDIFREVDLPLHPSYVRQFGTEPNAELFRARARPVPGWLGVDPSRIEFIRVQADPLWTGELDRIAGMEQPSQRRRRRD